MYSVRTSDQLAHHFTGNFSIYFAGKRRQPIKKTGKQRKTNRANNYIHTIAEMVAVYIHKINVYLTLIQAKMQLINKS